MRDEIRETTRYEKRHKNTQNTQMRKKMVKYESWTENTKADALHMSKETLPILWQSRHICLLETVEELRMTSSRIMRQYNAQGQE